MVATVVEGTISNLKQFEKFSFLPFVYAKVLIGIIRSIFHIFYVSVFEL